MGSNYILGPDGELYHAGIKGMKWGIRRYQNKDGSLTPAGKKRYAQEEAKLKEREKSIKGHERTKAKLAKLDAKKAELDAREKALNDPDKKTSTDNDKQAEKLASDNNRKSPKSMTDSELQSVVNRLRNEDAYKDLSKKLGYDGPVTEMDVKIAELKKQKEYLELQRDIAGLTPKQTSRGKEFVGKVFDKVIEPAVLEAGKSILKNYLTETGNSAVADLIAKAAADAKVKTSRIDRRTKAKIAKEAADEAKKAAKQEAKQQTKTEKQEAKQQAKTEKREAKRQAKEARQEAKQQAKDRETSNTKARETFYKNYTFDGEVEGSGRNSKTSGSNAGSKTSKTTIDAEYWRDVSDSPVTSLVTTGRSYSSGRSYVSGYLNSPVNSLPSPNISGYLPAPRDDD